MALVTGGGGGIGEATARLFSEDGAAVALIDVDAAAAEKAAAGIAADVRGAQVLPLGADLAREAEAARVVGATIARFGALHTLVNVAGIRFYVHLAAAKTEDWQQIWNVNVLATTFCCKAALPHGIRVNVVCPGGTITPYHIHRAAERGVSEAELRTSRAQDNGLFGRWAEPREVAYRILFLACAESSFITGTALPVDAGKHVV